MFAIIDTDNNIVDISASIDYCKTQENGVKIITSKYDADLVFSRNTNTYYMYPLYKVKEIDDIQSITEQQGLIDQLIIDNLNMQSQIDTLIISDLEV